MLPRARAAARRLDPRTMTSSDWDAVVGNKTTPTQTFTAVSQLPGGTNSQAGVVIPLNGVSWQIPPDPGGALSGWAFFDFTNSTINYRILAVHSTTCFIKMRNCTIDVPLSNMTPNQTNGGTLDDTGMSLYGVDVTSSIDGIWPSDGECEGVGNAAIIDLCRVTTPGYLPFTGFPLAPSNIPVTTVGLAGTTGTYCTPAQFQSVVQLQASTVYSAGAFVCPPGANQLYQVSTGGTSGSGTISGHTWWQTWPGGAFGSSSTMFKDLASNATSQPFTDGPDTLKLVYIGTAQHCDGIQIGRPGVVNINRTKISGFANSCVFVQSSARGYDGGNNPAGPVRIVNCDLSAASYLGALGSWIYTNTNTADPNGPTMVGRWVRTSGVWSAYSQPWLARPEGTLVVGNLFRSRVPDGGSPQFTAGGIPIQACSYSLLANGSGAVAVGDWPIFVRTADERNSGIVAQWTTPPPSTLADTGGVINTGMLETRWGFGVFPGAVDARSWIVWNNNIDDTGAVVYPTPRANAPGFDSWGYYIGTPNGYHHAAQVAFDATGAGQANGNWGTTTKTFSHTVSSGTNTAVLVGVGMATTGTVTWSSIAPTITFGGQPMTLLGVGTNALVSNGGGYVALYCLQNPTNTGTQTVSITGGASATYYWANSVSYTGVVTVGFPATVGHSASVPTPAIPVMSATSDMTVSILGISARTVSAPTQTARYSQSSASNSESGYIQDAAGLASAQVNFAMTSSAGGNWAGVGVDLMAYPPYGTAPGYIQSL